MCLAVVLCVGMLLANKYLSMGLAVAANTLLIAVFAVYLVKRDFPLRGLPVIGKHFK